jgi:PncC family amidohydrolase
MFFSESGKIEEALQNWFIQHHKRLALAESCTGGAMASQIVSVAGASEYFLGSFVVYCDALKMRMLAVSEQTLKEQGAVSEACVKEMWEGVFNHSDADFAIAVSGIAGPTGGSVHVPVGTVCAAMGERNKKPDIGTFTISGPRPKVIQTATHYLLSALYRKVAHGLPAFPLF